MALLQSVQSRKQAHGRFLSDLYRLPRRHPHDFRRSDDGGER